MARYEIGAVYKINAECGKSYYVRLLEGHWHGVFSCFNEEISEEIFSKTPYQLYIGCNSFPIKKEIWKKVLPAPNNNFSWKVPDLANYANFNPVVSIKLSTVMHEGNLHKCEQDTFISLVKTGMIANIFNRHEAIPAFLSQYYEGWPNSYILDKNFLESGTLKYQLEQKAILSKFWLYSNL